MQISQDDEGFEINSIRDSLDDSDLENGPGPVKTTPPESGPSSTGTADGIRVPSEPHRTVSPLPAPKPQRTSSLPKQSLDGETIFAVGDEDKFSDESDAEEHAGLVPKKGF
jgi:hypothetical protein